ncbi:cytochrome P450 4C1-like isoform X1 [Schistocerca piceifrons]|uniref:cytochrome P450 4C1-like isoform X1 n=1 Tax=Schistocerca piceifrons TaxID=274613 RepID=UPI001F5F3FAD|nr:cytochrome P450 4C1-like isoform X1 [Schistocerca piceifrons]XP_047112870.1 cytochrome P450 4C1-like isoform X1 [Schistocerca piceifrons]
MSVWTACWQGLGLVVGALLAVLSWLWITRPRTNAPGPTPLPLLGNLPHFWRKLPVVVNDFRKLQRCYGDVFRFYLGPKLILVATQPNDARRLLVGCKVRERDDFATRALFAYTGNGLIVSKGELWKAHRKIIEPTFHSEVLNGYMEAFNEGARFLCSQLEEAKGVAIDISKMLHHTSFHVLALSLFGISVDELEPDRRKQAEFVTVSLAALELIQKRFYQPWLQIDWIISLTPDGEALKEQMTVLNGIVKKGIALLREKKLKALPKKRKTFLDVMIDDRGNFLLSENEVFDEVRTFVLAASDSTATALSSIFALLGLHPEWQDAIQKEVDEIFGTGDHYLRPAIDSDLAQLKVTEAVIKESLRLFPAVPVAPVFASEDIPLSDGRYVAPRGSVVFVFLNLLHRQPALFPDPDKFEPRRFLEGGVAGALFPYSFLPFGAGSRLCVGARFAMLVMKTTLAMVMRQFRIVASCTREELEEIAVFITGKPVRGIRIQCIPRSAPTMKN